ncbi:hypothetical protein [Cellulosilyticum lentocellum]|uniref:Uncharacterized protein n=1 Tax=Cellulosilyticum lentocellum (strain ATCC 49066 / DSM 5427 / NCIMB 11756 / RHM5) TaxID=642492 RepID=F2JPI9_CELLD|nr:hypothetical protein [Cellulosilyticum lentocellum]ADZ82537.1 hypothetical protein Clole_0804 [Cellulosilyticum lentocellum DSM 5427]
MEEKLLCVHTVKTMFGDGTLFEKGKMYDFVKVDNKYSKQHGFIGYIKKDDEKYKRWLTRKFRYEHFRRAGEHNEV